MRSVELNRLGWIGMELRQYRRRKSEREINEGDRKVDTLIEAKRYGDAGIG